MAWLPDQQILFGGCFLKSVTSGGLGNVADSVVPDWAASIHRLQKQYPRAKMTIPGHGSIRDDPVAHTLELLSKTGG